MTVCLCGLTLSLLSALSADLSTTAEFTARGYHEVNPLARPFVRGRGQRGELGTGLVTAGAYVILGTDPRISKTSATVIQTMALAIHSTLAMYHVRKGVSREVTPIMFPILVVRW